MVAEKYDPGPLGRDDRSARPLVNHMRRLSLSPERPPAGGREGGGRAGLASLGRAWIAFTLRPPAFFLGLRVAAAPWTLLLGLVQQFFPPLAGLHEMVPEG